MEPIELFAMGVLAICAIHLATTAGTRIESWWRKGVRPQKYMASPRRERNDWYAFFHCADLVGPDSIWNSGQPQSAEKTASAGNQRRIVDKRPRLNA